MHELSIALNLIDIAEQEARQRGNPTIVALHLNVGEFSGVVPEALQSAYEIAVADTILAEARLVIKIVPVMMDCPVCQDQTAVASIQNLVCRNCGTPAKRIVSGRELEVTGLEIVEP